MRYDLHVHTLYSACSNLAPGKVLEVAKLRGLDGIAITDHNTIEGALQVKALNKDKRFEVIIGEEITTDHGHLLAYYLKRPIKPGSLKNVIEQAHRQKAIVAFAHPLDILRENASEAVVRKYARSIDALETYNARILFPWYQQMTADLARILGLPGIAGSDAHFSFEVGRAVTLFDGQLKQVIHQRTTSVQGSALLGPVGAAATIFYRFLC